MEFDTQQLDRTSIKGALRRLIFPERHGVHIGQEGIPGQAGGSQPGYTHVVGGKNWKKTGDTPDQWSFSTNSGNAYLAYYPNQNKWHLMVFSPDDQQQYLDAEYENPELAIADANELLGIETPLSAAKKRLTEQEAITPTRGEVFDSYSVVASSIMEDLKAKWEAGEDLDGRYLWFKKILDPENKNTMTLFRRGGEDLVDKPMGALAMYNIGHILLGEAERLGIESENIEKIQSWTEIFYIPDSANEYVEFFKEKGFNNFTANDVTMMARNATFSRGGSLTNDAALRAAEVTNQYLEGASDNPAVRMEIINTVLRNYTDMTEGAGAGDPNEYGVDTYDVWRGQKGALDSRNSNKPMHPDAANQFADVFAERGSTPGTREAHTLSRWTGIPEEQDWQGVYEDKLKWAAVNMADTIRPYQWIPPHEQQIGDDADVINDSWAKSTQTLDSILLTEMVAEEFGGESIPRERNRDLSTGVQPDYDLITLDLDSGMYHPVDEQQYQDYGEYANEQQLMGVMEVGGLKPLMLYGDPSEAKTVRNEALAHINDPARRETYRQWVKETYNETQEMLANWGYEPGEEIRLYRGSGSPPAGEGASDWNPSQQSGNQEVELWSLSSFSWDIQEARKFGDSGTIITADVPVSRLFCNWRTGMPCKYEGEWLVLGQDGLDAILYDARSNEDRDIMLQSERPKVKLDEFFSNWIAAILLAEGEDRNTIDAWDINPREKPEKAIPLKGQAEAVERHMGPGDHPSGSPQEVHDPHNGLSKSQRERLSWALGYDRTGKALDALQAIMFGEDGYDREIWQRQFSYYSHFRPLGSWANLPEGATFIDRFVFTDQPLSLEKILSLELAPFNDDAVGTFAREWYEREYGETNVFAFVGMVQDVSLGPLYKGFVVHPTVSTKSQHPWRATTFDQRGFIGHQYYETIEKAIAQELRITKSAKPNPKLFERIVMREEFQEGNRRSLMLNRSAPDNALATHLVDLINRHYGPGPHPGTGTPQEVHGNGGTGDADIFDEGIDYWADKDRFHPNEISRLFIDGKVVFIQEGEGTSITYTVQDQWAIRELLNEAGERRTIFTHNHPGDVYAGDGFVDVPPSFGDCHFAMKFDFDEWHVITPNGKWIVKKGEDVGRYYHSWDEGEFHRQWNSWGAENSHDHLGIMSTKSSVSIRMAAQTDPEFAKKFVDFRTARLYALEEITKLFDFEWVPNE